LLNASFGAESSGKEIFGELVAPLLASDAVSTTLLAYGQTGSGKTYSMAQMAKESLLALLPPPGVHREEYAIVPGQSLELAYVQLFGDQASDLTTNKSLSFKAGKHSSTSLVGMTWHKISSVEQGLDVLELGAAHRRVAATATNEESSRSHAILWLRHRGRILTLVDLAGSERVKVSETQGDQVREGSAINTSLSVLNSVIRALATGSSFVRYRDSRLTMLLRDSLGGNSRCSILVTLAPELEFLSESLSTLQFASSAMKVKNVVMVGKAETKRLLAAKGGEGEAGPTSAAARERAADAENRLTAALNEVAAVMAERDAAKARIDHLAHVCAQKDKTLEASKMFLKLAQKPRVDCCVKHAKHFERMFQILVTEEEEAKADGAAGDKAAAAAAGAAGAVDDQPQVDALMRRIENLEALLKEAKAATDACAADEDDEGADDDTTLNILGAMRSRAVVAADSPASASLDLVSDDQFDARVEVQQLQAQLQMAQGRINDLLVEAESGGGVAAELREQLAAATATLDRERAEFRADAKLVLAAAQKAESLLSAIKAELKVTEDGELLSHVKILLKNVDDLQVRLDSAEAAVEAAEAAEPVKDMRRRLEEACTESLEREDELMAEITAAHDRAERAEEERDQTMSSFEEVTMVLQSAQASAREAERLRTELEAMRREVTASRSEADSLRAELAETRRMYQELKEATSAADEQTNQLFGMLSSAPGMDEATTQLLGRFVTRATAPPPAARRPAAVPRPARISDGCSPLALSGSEAGSPLARMASDSESSDDEDESIIVVRRPGANKARSVLPASENARNFA
jgi:hypothetical protein